MKTTVLAEGTRWTFDLRPDGKLDLHSYDPWTCKRRTLRLPEVDARKLARRLQGFFSAIDSKRRIEATTP
jgi:hypothetical protein